MRNTIKTAVLCSSLLLAVSCSKSRGFKAHNSKTNPIVAPAGGEVTAKSCDPVSLENCDQNYINAVNSLNEKINGLNDDVKVKGEAIDSLKAEIDQLASQEENFYYGPHAVGTAADFQKIIDDKKKAQERVKKLEAEKSISANEAKIAELQLDIAKLRTGSDNEEEIAKKKDEIIKYQGLNQQLLGDTAEEVAVTFTDEEVYNNRFNPLKKEIADLKQAIADEPTSPMTGVTSQLSELRSKLSQKETEIRSSFKRHFGNAVTMLGFRNPAPDVVCVNSSEAGVAVKNIDTNIAAIESFVEKCDTEEYCSSEDMKKKITELEDSKRICAAKIVPPSPDIQADIEKTKNIIEEMASKQEAVEAKIPTLESNLRQKRNFYTFALRDFATTHKEFKKFEAGANIDPKIAAGAKDLKVTLETKIEERDAAFAEWMTARSALEKAEVEVVARRESGFRLNNYLTELQIHAKIAELDTAIKGAEGNQDRVVELSKTKGILVNQLKDLVAERLGSSDTGR